VCRITKSVVTKCVIRSKNYENALVAGAPPWTKLRELTALPRPLAGLRGKEERKGAGKGRDGKEIGSGKGGGWIEMEKDGGQGREGMGVAH